MRNRIWALLCGLVYLTAGLTLSAQTPATLTAGQWLALPLPSSSEKGGLPGSLKHVSGGYNPVDHRLYFTAGDYSGPSASSSYRQETWSLSLKDRLADPANPIAGWRLEVPYCSGSLQPKWPDFGGFHWDSKRSLFWWIAGTTEVNTSAPCTGETPDKQDNPGFSFGHLMTYDPVAKVWANIGPQGPSFTKVWDSIYDAKTDAVIAIRQGSSAGDVWVDTYSVFAQGWTKSHVFAAPAVGKTLYGIKGYAAFDEAGRSIYWIDPFARLLLQYQIDVGTLTNLGPIPDVPMYPGNQPKIIWDPHRHLVYWHNHTAGQFYAYHVDSGKWETLSTRSNLPGIEACNATVMAYDPDLDLLVSWGDVWGADGSCNANARPYLFLYRYSDLAPAPAPSPTPVPSTPPPPPVITLTANPSTVTAGQASMLTTAVQVDGPVGALSLTHDDAVSPTATQTYTATVAGVQASATVTVTAPVLVPSLPQSAIDGLAPGMWYEAPNSHLDDAGIYPSPKPLGNLTTRAVMDAWGGGAYDSTRDQLLVHGGGHADYAGNEIYAFSIANLTWSRIWGPTPNDQIPPQPATAGETYFNGDPRSVHSYSGLVYLPLPNKLLRYGGSLWSGSGGFSLRLWLFDMATSVWEPKLDFSNHYIPLCAYDSVTTHVFCELYSNLWEYDPVMNTATKRSGASAGYSPQGGVAIDQKTRQLVFLGLGNGTTQVFSYKLDTYPAPLVNHSATISGATEVLTNNQKRPAMAWDDAAQRLVLWNGGTALYTLDTTTWVITKHEADPANTVTPDLPNSAGTYGRFAYLPSHDVFVLVNRTSGSVYFVKANF